MFMITSLSVPYNKELSAVSCLGGVTGSQELVSLADKILETDQMTTEVIATIEILVRITWELCNKLTPV